MFIAKLERYYPDSGSLRPYIMRCTEQVGIAVFVNYHGTWHVHGIVHLSMHSIVSVWHSHASTNLAWKWSFLHKQRIWTKNLHECRPHYVISAIITNSAKNIHPTREESHSSSCFGHRRFHVNRIKRIICSYFGRNALRSLFAQATKHNRSSPLLCNANHKVAHLGQSKSI